MPKLLKVSEVARIQECSTQYIRSLLKKKFIKAYIDDNGYTLVDINEVKEYMNVKHKTGKKVGGNLC
jgi:hypothetical protein